MEATTGGNTVAVRFMGSRKKRDVGYRRTDHPRRIVNRWAPNVLAAREAEMVSYRQEMAERRDDSHLSPLESVARNRADQARFEELKNAITRAQITLSSWEYNRRQNPQVARAEDEAYQKALEVVQEKDDEDKSDSSVA